jgi:glycosyltransferase involved in cell wall biosynthesis
MPLLSILTRSYLRPDQLERCVKSVINQTDPDFEHIIIPDEIGHGLYWANRQIAECSTKVRGNYIYVLDDDDYIVSPFFIAELKKFLSNFSAIKTGVIIVCCGTLNEEFFPKVWKKPFERGKIAAPNLIVSRQLFETHAHMWDQPRAGDFAFLQSALKENPHIFWWDYNVFCAQSSCGFTEKEQRKYGMI